MLPDIIGYKLEEGMNIISSLYSSKDQIIITQYNPPKSCIQAQEKRILRAYMENGKIILIVSDF